MSTIPTWHNEHLSQGQTPHWFRDGLGLGKTVAQSFTKLGLEETFTYGEKYSDNIEVWSHSGSGPFIAVMSYGGRWSTILIPTEADLITFYQKYLRSMEADKRAENIERHLETLSNLALVIARKTLGLRVEDDGSPFIPLDRFRKSA